MTLNKVCEPGLISPAISSLKWGFRSFILLISVFIRRTFSSSMILVVYIDDILPIKSDGDSIKKAKKYLKTQFVTKDMGMPKYVLGIEISQSKHGVVLSQRKYALDLQEIGLLGSKPVCTHMNTDVDLWDKTRLLFKYVSH